MSRRPDVDELMQRLDAFLMSDRSPPDSMMLSDLDGFLTGIAIGPELIMPSQWLSAIWGGEEPVFENLVEAQAIHTAIMCRYNEIITQVERGEPNPIFLKSDDDVIFAGDWAEGFMQAIDLRPTAWQKMFEAKSMTPYVLPILALCGDEKGDPLIDIPPDLEDQITEIADEAIPICITEIAAFWRKRRSAPSSTIPKVGRNDPCPCGSGIKYKKCCGTSA